jgi:histidine triad (HIT) family protein
MEPDCPFCKIIRLETDTKILYQDEFVTAFPDAHPIAPVHVLIVPNRHILSTNQLELEDEQVVGRMVRVAVRMAFETGVSVSGYRLVFNCGPDAGQSVAHMHLHMIGGRHLPFRFE